jgi:hypothetical protein
MRIPHTLDFGKFKDRDLEEIPRLYLESAREWDIPKGYDPEEWNRLQIEIQQELALRDGDKGVWPKAVKGLAVTCVCGCQLHVQGGLLLGVPTPEGLVTMTNLCRNCMVRVRAFMRTLRPKGKNDESQ